MLSIILSISFILGEKETERETEKEGGREGGRERSSEHESSRILAVIKTL